MFYNKFTDLNLTTNVKIKEQNQDNTDKSTWQTEIDALLHY